jgi:hypothetical protein
VATCRQWARALARRRGDCLPTQLADDLAVYATLCELQAAIRDGLPELPRGD